MKVYITRDEDSDRIWIWLKPKKGNHKPEQLPDCEVVNFQRPASMDEIDKYCCYDKLDFKNKFGVAIPKKKTMQSIHLVDELVLDNELAISPLFKGK